MKTERELAVEKAERQVREREYWTWDWEEIQALMSWRDATSTFEMEES